MSTIIESIKERRSVRSYDGHLIDDSIKEKLADFMENIKNPFEIPVAFKFLDAKEHPSSSERQMLSHLEASFLVEGSYRPSISWRHHHLNLLQ